jgi:hypothetical protein
MYAHLGWVNGQFEPEEDIDTSQDGAYQYMREVNNGKKRKLKIGTVHSRTSSKSGKKTESK